MSVNYEALGWALFFIPALVACYGALTRESLTDGQGVAAISMIRLSGPKAIALTDLVFKGTILEKAESHTLHYGRIVDEEGAFIDEVVVGIYRGPNSYTAEDVIEISCHGSPYIVREIMALLIRQGARPADAGEFTMRAFLHGKMDLSQAEAVADLIASQTRASCRCCAVVVITAR